MKRASVVAGLALAAASTAQAQGLADRYGPSPSAQPTPLQPYSPTGPGVRSRMLEWPGKTNMQATMRPALASVTRQPQPLRRYGGAAPTASWARPAPVPASTAYNPLPAPSADAQRAYAPPAYAQPAYARPAYALAIPARPAQAPPRSLRSQDADQEGWRPVFADAAPGSAGQRVQPALAGAPGPLPTSIYAPAQSPPTPSSIAASLPMSPESRAASLPPPRGYVPRLTPAERAKDEGVRFYSVHRAFGLQPDAAPIPPQFFTATADLSEPPGPLPTERSTASSKTGVSVHATPDTGTN